MKIEMENKVWKKYRIHRFKELTPPPKKKEKKKGKALVIMI